MNKETAFATSIVILIIDVVLNLAVMAALGAVIAGAWNLLLVPNVTATLPTLTWLQCAAGIFVLRILFGVIRGPK